MNKRMNKRIKENMNMKKMVNKVMAMAVTVTVMGSIAACGNNSPKAAVSCKTETDHNWVTQTQMLHHESTGHYEMVGEEESTPIAVWVVDQEACDKEIVTGYRCSICGQKK